MLAAAALVSCSESNDVVMPSTDGTQIALKSVTYELDVVTRAPFEGAIDVTNPLEARIIGSLDSDFSTPYVDGTMLFNGTGAVTFANVYTGNSEFNVDNDDVYLFGIYPAGVDFWTEETADATYSCTFTGKEDVMGTEDVKVANRANVDAKNYETLTFSHLLTKLNISMRADQKAIAAFDEVTSIRLIGDDVDGSTKFPNSIVFDGLTGDAIDGATETDAMNFYTISGDAPYINQTYTLTQNSVLQAYAMVYPHAALAAGADAYFLEVATPYAADPTKQLNLVPVKLYNKAVAGAAATPFRGSTAGYSFDINLYFRATGEIMAEAYVNEWKAGGETEVEI